MTHCDPAKGFHYNGCRCFEKPGGMLGISPETWFGLQDKVAKLKSTMNAQTLIMQDYRKQIADYEAALEWYGDQDNYESHSEALSCGCCSTIKDPAAEEDQGARARETLNRWRQNG